MSDLYDRVEHHYADSGGVKIHYVTTGTGPLVVMVHGYPDFWYSWRDQMAALEGSYRVAAMDLRGYNRSDKPEDDEAYSVRHLVADVAAVIRDQGEERAIVVGHDWGGLVAWSTAMRLPQLVERLVVLNIPHPEALARELAHDPQQVDASQYARDFQQPGSHEALTAEGLAGWVRDPEARARYVEAFERSDFDAMMAYYRVNYPHPPYRELDRPMPRVTVPVLQIHGLRDRYLLSGGLDGTWDLVDADLTLVTIPGAGHFVQQDASDLVSRSILAWLGR